MNDAGLAGNAKTAVDFLGHEWHFDCMGCAVVKGDIAVPGGIIYEGNAVVLAADPETPIPGFLIINTKKHIRSLSELTNPERHEMIDVAACAEKALKSLGIAEVTLVQEERSSHCHLWIFPYHDWMVEYGRGIAYLRNIAAAAKENLADGKVRETLAVTQKVREYFESHDIAE